MKIIEVTRSNFDRYAQCTLKATIEYRKSGLDLSDDERKDWLFNKIYELFDRV